METLERVLREHSFLEGLPDRHLATLVGCASQVRFTENSPIFQMGLPADNFFLIRHGKAALGFQVPERGSITVQTVEDGEVLGWSWLVKPYRWALDAHAVDETLALKFDAACLRGKMEVDHDLGYELYKRFAPVIAQRLQATRVQVLDVHQVYA